MPVSRDSLICWVQERTLGATSISLGAVSTVACLSVKASTSDREFVRDRKPHELRRISIGFCSTKTSGSLKHLCRTLKFARVWRDSLEQRDLRFTEFQRALRFRLLTLKAPSPVVNLLSISPSCIPLLALMHCRTGCWPCALHCTARWCPWQTASSPLKVIRLN